MTDKNQNDEQTPNIRFTVMPDLEGIGRMPPKPSAGEVKSSPPTPPPAPPPPPARPAVLPPRAEPPRAASKTPLTGDLRDNRAVSDSSFRRSLKKIILAGVIVVILAAGGAFAYSYWQDRQSQTGAQQNQNQNQNNQTDNNIDLTKDTDNDGLTDIEERDLGTDPNHPDTDGDGLADGDEVKEFNSSPLSIHSDADRYDDGKELRDGYSLLIGGSAQLTEDEINKIITLLSNNSLHQPTVNTLLQSTFWQKKVPHLIGGNTGAQNGNNFFYEDSVYGYQLVLPGSWRRTGENPTNLVFIENGSATARYVQIQAFVGINDQGEISGQSLVESEVERLTKIAVAGVDVRETTLGGLPAYRLAAESERGSSGSATSSLRTSTVEYIVNTSTATFLVTISCTSDSGVSCMPEVEQLAKNIETGLKF